MHVHVACTHCIRRHANLAPCASVAIIGGGRCGGNACRRAGVAARAQTAPDPDARAAAPGGATSSIASRCLGNARAREAHEKLPLEGTCVSST